MVETLLEPSVGSVHSFILCAGRKVFIGIIVGKESQTFLEIERKAQKNLNIAPNPSGSKGYIRS
jgi:hypothetical protein